MGTTGGNRIAEVLYSSDPRHYDKVDWVFAFGLVLVVAGALVMFWAESVAVTVLSIVGMFTGICVMLLCLGVSDRSGEASDGGENMSAEAAFKSGDAFEEDERSRGIGREKGPKRRN